MMFKMFRTSRHFVKEGSLCINKTLFWTTFYSALFSTLTLKFFHMFNFIKWSPVGWADKWQLFATVHFTFKWVLFFIVLALLFAILYIAVSFTSSIPPSVTALTHRNHSCFCD